mmetsp:Transcript_7900/g.31214  ORF Transcript_7900/g.31214 Transcript_7900/m.31214 type:complete len:274 (-) Transcript_7900:3605-4426(-)
MAASDDGPSEPRRSSCCRPDSRFVEPRALTSPAVGLASAIAMSRSRAASGAGSRLAGPATTTLSSTATGAKLGAAAGSSVPSASGATACTSATATAVPGAPAPAPAAGSDSLLAAAGTGCDPMSGPPPAGWTDGDGEPTLPCSLALSGPCPAAAGWPLGSGGCWSCREAARAMASISSSDISWSSPPCSPSGPPPGSHPSGCPPYWAASPAAQLVGPLPCPSSPACVPECGSPAGPSSPPDGPPAHRKYCPRSVPLSANSLAPQPGWNHCSGR